MKKIKVYWEERMLQTWSIEVEAETEDDAIRFIQDEKKSKMYKIKITNKFDSKLDKTHVVRIV